MRRRLLGMLPAAFLCTAGVCGPLPPPVVVPTTMTVYVEVYDAQTDAKVPGASVRYWYAGPTADSAVTQAADAQGNTAFIIPASVRDSHMWVSAEGYVTAGQHVDARPNVHVRFHLAKPPPPAPPPAPLRGQLRIVNGGFADVLIGPTNPVYCHFGDGFSAYTRTPEPVLVQLDIIAKAGYRGIRFWTNLGFNWWTPWDRKVGPSITPEYWPKLQAFLEALKVRGLTAVISQGDVGYIPNPVTFMRRLGETVNASGVVADLVDAGNEAWGTGEGDADALAEMVSAFRAVCPGPLLTLTSPQAEDKAGLDYYAQPPADLFDVHGYRSGHWRDKVRHIFSVAYEQKPAKRLGIQSEPTGPGELVSVTENKHELTDDTLAAMAVMSLLSRQAWVYMSGHGVVWRGPLEDQPGFWAVPQAVALLPADITSWPTLIHGGETWASRRIFAAHGPTRWDHALSGDGRWVALGYGPDGVMADRPVCPVVIDVDRTFGNARLVVGR